MGPIRPLKAMQPSVDHLTSQLTHLYNKGTEQMYIDGSFQLESFVVLSHKTSGPQEELKQMVIPSVPWRVQWATRGATVATSLPR